MAALKVFVSGPGRLPAGSRARHAPRRGAGDRIGVRIQPLAGHLGLVAAQRRVGLPAVAVPALRATRAPARSAAVRRPGGRGRPSVPRGTSVVELSGAVRGGLFWAGARAGGARPCEVGRRAGADARRARWPSGRRCAAAVLVPFAELLAHSSDADLRSRRRGLLQAPPRFVSACCCTTTGGRPRGGGVRVAAPRARLLRRRADADARDRRARGTAGARRGSPWRASASRRCGLHRDLPALRLVLELPGFSAAHNGRFAVVAVLCLAVLAGWGLDDLTGQDLPAARRRWLAGLAVALAALPLVVVAAGADRGATRSARLCAWPGASRRRLRSWPRRDRRPEGRGRAGLAVRVAGARRPALALLLLRLRGRLGTAAFVGLAVGLVALDLVRRAWATTRRSRSSHAEQPATPAIRYLQDKRPARFTALRPEARSRSRRRSRRTSSMRYGLYDTRGYVIPTEERYSRSGGE